MHTEKQPSRQFEFYMSDLDLHVVVENTANAVVIRASRDSLSRQQKTFFVRRLAAEGHIPDIYEWFPEAEANGFSGVQWVIDSSQAGHDPEIHRRATRREVGVVLLGCLLVLSLHWGVLPGRTGMTSHGGWAQHEVRPTDSPALSSSPTPVPTLALARSHSEAAGDEVIQAPKETLLNP